MSEKKSIKSIRSNPFLKALWEVFNKLRLTVEHGGFVLEQVGFSKPVVDAFVNEDKIYLSIPFHEFPVLLDAREFYGDWIKDIEKRNHVKVIHLCIYPMDTNTVELIFLCVPLGVKQSEWGKYCQPVDSDQGGVSYRVYAVCGHTGADNALIGEHYQDVTVSLCDIHNKVVPVAKF